MPLWSEIVFLFALAWGLFFLFRATRSVVLLLIVAGWSGILIVMAGRGFFAPTDTLPPRPLFAVVPLVLGILALLSMPAGRRFLARADLIALTALHVLRVPVEIVLDEAWLQGEVPRQMTWSGTNFDILSGLSAALLVPYLMRSRPWGRRMLIAWNIVALLLLLNVVIAALLSFPSPLQVLNADEPLTLVVRAPYILLPGVIVPMVLFAHVAALSRMARSLAP